MSSSTTITTTITHHRHHLPHDALLPARLRTISNAETIQTRQRLIYRGKVLADAEPLSAYKVEDGHFVHMVARPEGVHPAASPLDPARAGSSQAAGNAVPAAGAAAGGAPQTGGQLHRAGGLSERLLMGTGTPAGASTGATAAGGGGTAAAAAAGAQARQGRTHGIDHALLNAAAGLEQGDFLSNMLALGGDGGGRGAGVGATRAALRAPRNPLADGLVGGRRVSRGQQGGGRSATAAAASPLLGRGGDAEQQGVGGSGGSVSLEHVRQGLLTLHTLLSGTATRTLRRQPESSAGSPVAVSWLRAG